MPAVKILIVRFSSIGDIVLTSPVIRCLKEQIKDVEIHFCTKEKFRGLVEPNPHISKVITLNGSLMGLTKELRNEQYDVIIDLHKNLRTFRLRLGLLKPTKLTFKKLNFQKWLLVNFGINKLPDKHIVERYMEPLKQLHVKYDGKGLDYFFPKDGHLPGSMVDVLPKGPFVAYVMGGTYATKKLPLAKMRTLFEVSTVPIVLLGDQADNKMAMIAALGYERNVLNLCGKLSLSLSARVLEKAEWVISHDTGLMHIAAALRKPMVSVWGNTVPEFGMSPFYPDDFDQSRSVKAEVLGLKCRPCSKLGFQSCPRNHFNCMNLQDISIIASPWGEGQSKVS